MQIGHHKDFVQLTLSELIKELWVFGVVYTQKDGWWRVHANVKNTSIGIRKDQNSILVFFTLHVQCVMFHP